MTTITLTRVLLVEDNPADIRLLREVLKESQISSDLSVVMDGERAISFLRKEGEYENVNTPQLILLDLNLPRKSGHEVLADIKADMNLKHIPVIILTTSSSEKDILKSYAGHANCYVTKPHDYNQFASVVQSIKEFWLRLVKLPAFD